FTMVTLPKEIAMKVRKNANPPSAFEASARPFTLVEDTARPSLMAYMRVGASTRSATTTFMNSVQKSAVQKSANPNASFTANVDAPPKEPAATVITEYRQEKQKQ